MYKRLSFFDANDRQEKERQIVVSPFQVRLVQSTRRAHLGMVIEKDCFWLYSSD
jgi:hypothetical protein